MVASSIKNSQRIVFPKMNNKFFSLVKKLNEICERTDYRVGLETMQRIIKKIGNYQQLFMCLLEDSEPEYDGELDDYKHPFIEDKSRIKCID